MKRPFGLKVELPRKGSTMTSVYDPTLGSFVLAEEMASGKLAAQEWLSLLAFVGIDLANEICLRSGGAPSCITYPTPKTARRARMD